ncbi:MAG: glycosyltransferase [Lachnospiraceae bacterium]
MDNEKRMLNVIKEYDEIIIYGAGMVGELVIKRLLKLGYGNRIVGVAVSKKNDFEFEICNIKIYEITELKKYASNAIVIIATMPDLHEEIYRHVLHRGFLHVMPITLDIYRSMQKNYISEANKKNEMMITDKKNKILLVPSDNNRTSGAFLCMVELSKMLMENNFFVLVVLPEYGTGESLLVEKNIPYIYIASVHWGFEIKNNKKFLEKVKFYYQSLRNIAAIKKFVRVIKENQISIVHCNTTFTYVGAIAAKICRVPVVWHFREDMRVLGYRIFWRKRADRLMNQSAKIIDVSEYIKATLGYGNDEKHVIIHDTVDVEKFYNANKRIMCSNIIRMIIVGAISHQKGIQELIEACYLLKESNVKNFRLEIVGKGKEDYVQKIKQLIEEKGLKSEVNFYGVTNRIQDIYEQADISFTCGEAEAFGRVTVEAQLSGCLVIGARSGATPELIEDKKTGFLYEKGNSEELAGIIKRAINYPDISRRIADQGQKYARVKYSQEQYIEKVKGTYREAMMNM